MANLVTLKQLNFERWQRCNILPNRFNEVMATARRLCEPDTKARFQGVSDRLAELAQTDPKIVPVPWWFIGVVAEREYGADVHGHMHWDRQLGQGDPLNRVSTHVPRGMGPYLDHPGDITPGHDAWTRCCLDVLINSAPRAGKWTDWTIGGVLTLWILYNGTGYEDFHHMPSPYDWGATNIQQRGKYVGDGHFDAHVWDTQVGCAAMLKGMMIVDPTITVDASAPAVA
jgi:lysozyme family protein